MVTNDGSNGKISVIDVRNDGKATVGDVADIEKAISATGYGVFNVLLLLAALPIAWTGIFDTTTTAMILASAECDLQLSYVRKGVLIAAPFIGMILTGFIWDHITPYIGARNLFILGLLIDSILNILASAVDSYYTFLLIKIISGIFVGGPFSMVMSYLSEFHSARYKKRFVRWAGLAANVAITVPAILAFFILPLPLVVDVFNRRYNAWRIYLLSCSIVPILGLLTSTTLPHTPRYLVEVGKPEEALSLLRRMYSMNKRKPADTFPVKGLLVWETISSNQGTFLKTHSEKLRLACYNAKLLFSTPYSRAVGFLSFLQFGSMLGFNTVRLWLPHLFIILSNFDEERWTMEDRRPTMSEMLDRRMSSPARKYLNCPTFDDICLKWKISSSIYGNSAIIAASTVLLSFLADTITSSYKKSVLLLVAFLLAIVSSFGMNWAQYPPYMLVLASAIIVTTRITGNIVASVNVDVIPLPLRSSTTNLLVIVGNLATIVGNVTFSALLDVEKLVSLLGMGVLFVACFCLAIFYPTPVRATGRSIVRSNA